MRSTLGSHVARTIALSTMFAFAAAAQPARGTTFGMHVKITAVGDGPMATAMQAQQAEWRGVATSVANRGRIDIVEGGQPPLIQQGDFMLFEGADAIVVRPTDKSFVMLQLAQMGNRALLGGLQITLKNIVTKLDTLGAGETIEGRPTQRYRLSASYEMTMAAMAGGPPISTTQTSDYWFAAIPDVPATPFNKTAGSDGRVVGPMAELADKVTAATAGLPREGMIVRHVTSSRITMAGTTAGIDNTTEISNLKKADVDLDRLVLPSGLTQRTLPGLPAPDSTSSAAAETKWRTRPKP